MFIEIILQLGNDIARGVTRETKKKSKHTRLQKMLLDTLLIVA